MSRTDPGTPAWLFSFVDLAFLMVIAMTQLADDVGANAPDLGEMVVPRIAVAATENTATGAAKAWQVRVHPRVADEAGVFELRRIEGNDVTSEPFDDAKSLGDRLAELAGADEDRPLLAPHEDSRSQDMLDAAAEIEILWPGRRRATVSRYDGA